VRSPGQSPSRSATLSAGITLRPAVDPAPIGLVCRRPMAAGQVHAQIVPSGGTGASCWSRRAICAVHRARNAYDAGSHQRSAGSPPARQPVDALRGPLPHPGACTGGSRLWFPSLRLAFQKGHLTAQTWWAQVGSNYRLLACKAEYGQEYAQLTGPVHSLDLRKQCLEMPSGAWESLHGGSRKWFPEQSAGHSLQERVRAWRTRCANGPSTQPITHSTPQSCSAYVS